MRVSGGSSAAASFGGIRRTLDATTALNVMQTSDVSSGVLPPSYQYALLSRTGTLYGAFWAIGAANGPDGLSLVNGRTMYAMPVGVGVRRDVYAAYHPGIKLVRPPAVFDDPFAVWEVEAHVALTNPAATPNEDMGLFFHCNCSVTGYAVGFTVGQALGNPGHTGFGIQMGAAGQPMFVARKALGGAALSETISLGGTGPWIVPRIQRWKVRIFSATPVADAKVEIYIDDVLSLTRSFTAGTTMPNTTDTLGWVGAFRVWIRMFANNPSANVFYYGSVRIGCASSVANLL